ncbi:MAG: flagellar biosynthesis protein FlhF [Lachnospiraceae bacterium]|nr:flagellar biosynthesis protein FlhF [Lachnospiraceae bacterium]
MTIKKFSGKTKEEAIEAAKKELGSQVVIMNIKEQKQGGIMGLFKAPIYEVTAAIEENDHSFPPVQKSAPSTSGNHFEAVADEAISLKPETPSKTTSSVSNVNEADLKSAFREIGEMVEKSEKESAIDLYAKPAKKTTSLDTTTYVKSEEETKTFVSFSDMNTKAKEPIVQPKSSPSQAVQTPSMNNKEQLNFLKMLYNILMDNEVDERYVNQILDDLGNVISSGSSLDYLISNVYQKMVLKFGKPNVITLSEKKPKIVFVIGPTGVGKTTTIAKIASKFKIEHKKNVAFITTDTYRIAAADQLNVYANILSSPVSIVYDINDFNTEVEKYKDMDLVLVDTAGFSHKNQVQKDDLKKLLSTVSDEYEKEIFLVLSATTKYHDLKEIVDTYKNFTSFKIIFTKLDETISYGNLLNMKLYTNADLSYVTTGQTVPDDIEVIDSQKIVKQLLGGH